MESEVNTSAADTTRHVKTSPTLIQVLFQMVKDLVVGVFSVVFKFFCWAGPTLGLFSLGVFLPAYPHSPTTALHLLGFFGIITGVISSFVTIILFFEHQSRGVDWWDSPVGMIASVFRDWYRNAEKRVSDKTN